VGEVDRPVATLGTGVACDAGEVDQEIGIVVLGELRHSASQLSRKVL